MADFKIRINNRDEADILFYHLRRLKVDTADIVVNSKTKFPVFIWFDGEDSGFITQTDFNNTDESLKLVLPEVIKLYPSDLQIKIKRKKKSPKKEQMPWDQSPRNPKNNAELVYKLIYYNPGLCLTGSLALELQGFMLDRKVGDIDLVIEEGTYLWLPSTFERDFDYEDPVGDIIVKGILNGIEIEIKKFVKGSEVINRPWNKIQIPMLSIQTIMHRKESYLTIKDLPEDKVIKHQGDLLNYYRSTFDPHHDLITFPELPPFERYSKEIQYNSYCQGIKDYRNRSKDTQFDVQQQFINYIKNKENAKSS